MDGCRRPVIVGDSIGACCEFSDYDLKVLAGHPDGRASVSELTRCVSILMSSGSDWTDRMRRLAARAPKLEIFTDTFLLRDDRGWAITDSGRRFLAFLEAPTPASAKEDEQPSSPPLSVTGSPQNQPAIRLVVDNTLAAPSGPIADGTRRSA